MACKIAPSQRLRLLPLSEAEEQGVRKENKDNGELETEHQGRTGSNFSHHAAKSDAELPETLVGNVLKTGDTTSQTIYSGSEYCNKKL
jgi:hypothetical protein